MEENNNLKFILEEKKEFIEKKEIDLFLKGIKLEKYLPNIKGKEIISIEEFKEIINKLIEKKGLKYFLEKLSNYIMIKVPELSRILAIVIDDNKKVIEDKAQIYNYWLRVYKINKDIDERYTKFDDIGISKTICKIVLEGDGKIIYIKDIKKREEYKESSICKKMKKEDTLSMVSGCIYLKGNTSIIIYIDKIYPKNTNNYINKYIKNKIKLFLANLKEILEEKILSKKVEEIKKYSSSLENIVGISEEITEVKNKTVEFSKSSIDVILIYGETGTGKKEVCDSINKIVNDGKNKSYKIFQACKEGNIFETELFGCKGGAYTSGPKEDRPGLLEKTSKEEGILFIDNIQYISEDLQKKLLEVIENKYIHKVGDLKEKIDVSGIKKFIFITNKDIENLKDNGVLLKDFYYRINKAILYIPPLRERKKDIPLLIKHFIKKHGEEKEFTPDLIEYLQNKEWKGNVRELKKEVERICNLIQDDIIDLNSYLEKFNDDKNLIKRNNNKKIIKIEEKENNNKNYKFFIKEELIKNNWSLGEELIKRIEDICKEEYGVSKIKKDTIYKIKYELVLEDIKKRIKTDDINKEELKNKKEDLINLLMEQYSIRKREKVIDLIEKIIKEY